MAEPTKKMRTLVIDDSPFFRMRLTEYLATRPGIEIVGSAAFAFEGQKKVEELTPDIVVLEIAMPQIDSTDFFKKMTSRYPVKVILVSSSVISAFDMVSYNAVDYVQKPEGTASGDVSSFLQEVGSKVLSARLAKAPTQRVATPQFILPPPVLNKAEKLKNIIIALGASTGGTEATLDVLKKLPAHTPGILVVQHMPVGFTKMYAQRLDSLCKMTVQEAKNGDRIEQGKVLIAPGDQHMRVVKIGNIFSVNCAQGEKVSGHCPSVDALFTSVAENVNCDKVGIILTGMGQDGAAGLLKMRESGAYTIGQDRESSVVYGMPMVAYNKGAVMAQAPLNKIADVLVRHLNKITG